MSVIYEDTNYGLKGFNELERAALEEGVCFASKNILEINNPAWSDRDYDEVMEDLIENEKAKGKTNGNIITQIDKDSLLKTYSDKPRQNDCLFKDQDAFRQVKTDLDSLFKTK